MAEASDTLGIVYQNLLDAGFDEQTTRIYMDFAKSGEWNKLTKHLTERKKVMLKQLHIGKKQIDCLDFLVYQIKKQLKQEEQL